MTSTPTPSEQEGIEYLATKVMLWLVSKDKTKYFRDIFESVDSLLDESSGIPCDSWNPYTDSNHFRQLELKVMEDERLAYRYCSKLIGEQWKNCEPMTVDSRQKGYVSRAMIIAMKADLPTRCTALITAHKALYPSP